MDKIYLMAFLWMNKQWLYHVGTSDGFIIDEQVMALLWITRDGIIMDEQTMALLWLKRDGFIMDEQVMALLWMNKQWLY